MYIVTDRKWILSKHLKINQSKLLHVELLRRVDLKIYILLGEMEEPDYRVASES